MAVAAYVDMLGAKAFGNFRTLLEEVTPHGMGVYLNMRGNQKEDPATGRQPDENYAREVMQLFTIGLYQLNPDGTPSVDGQPRSRPTPRPTSPTWRGCSPAGTSTPPGDRRDARTTCAVPMASTPAATRPAARPSSA